MFSFYLRLSSSAASWRRRTDLVHVGGNMENDLVNNHKWELLIEAQADGLAGFLAVAGMKMLVVSFS
jgi:hypothetical protein